MAISSGGGFSRNRNRRRYGIYDFARLKNSQNRRRYGPRWQSVCRLRHCCSKEFWTATLRCEGILPCNFAGFTSWCWLVGTRRGGGFAARSKFLGLLRTNMLVLDASSACARSTRAAGAAVTHGHLGAARVASSGSTSSLARPETVAATTPV